MSVVASERIVNVPNVLTTARLLLAVVVFVLVENSQYSAALAVFLVAASTDWVDGYWARRFGQVSKVGRILDPFVDKIIICGTFIYLAAAPLSGIPPWVAVVVVGRELLVTALRSAIEASGGDFSATWPGKWKMLFQCVAASASLLKLAYGNSPSPAFLPPVLWVSVWLTVASTIYSGLDYVVAAARRWRA
jgi:CDP-diacylglycerol--glycerol-3-phosphate 3-phosphatidyltransferase